MIEDKMIEDKIDFISRYEAIRNYVIHEDTLINNRLTWLLVSQGLIFGAFSALFKPMADIASKLSEHPSSNNEVVIILSDLERIQCILSWIGLFICLISFFGIEAAVRSIREIEKNFNGVSQQANLPDLTGGGSRIAHDFGIVSPRGIPIVLFCAWLSVILKLNLPFTHYQPFVIAIVSLIVGITLTVWVYSSRYNLTAIQNYHQQ
jgi:hypothetical protein